MTRYTGYAAAVLFAAGMMSQGTVAPAQDFGPPGAVVEPSAEYEVLTSGPIHEAFANPYSPDPVPGIVVQVQPPDPIDEMPPTVAPAGPDVQWIPGYWGWDVAREGFVWISGVWRSVPPRQQWIPGYWAQVEDGFQWVSGFWTSEEVQELTYLPYPPESQEQGPTIPQPSPNHFWVPGVWVFEGNRYQWRPGHWSPAYEGWVWAPARYIWTPYGAVYTNGFWDRTIVERGMLFCPVAFERDFVFTRYEFTPTVVVDTRPLLVHMFVSPSYNHYFFGNYYGFDYGPRTLLPWHAYWQQPGYYDPLLTYYDWSYGRRNVNFIQRLQIWNQYFISNVDHRPPRTFGEQRLFVDRFGRDRAFGGDRDGLFSRYALSRPLDEFVSEHDDHRHFHHLERQQRQELVDLSHQTRQLQQQRAELEGSLGARGRTDDDVGQRRQIQQPRTLELSGLDRVRREQRAWRGRIEQDQPAQDQPAEGQADGRIGQSDRARTGETDRGRTGRERGRRAQPTEILPELPPEANVPQQRAGRSDDDARPGRGPALPGARPETAGQPGHEPRIGGRDRDDRGQPGRGQRGGESPGEQAQQQPVRPGFTPRAGDPPGARLGQPAERELQPGRRDDDHPGARRGQPGQRDLQPGLTPRAEDRREQPGQREELRPGFTPGDRRGDTEQRDRAGRTDQPPTLDQLRDRMQTPRGEGQQRETRRPRGPVPGAQPGSVPQAGERTPSPRPGQAPGAPSLDELRQRGRNGQTTPGLTPGETRRPGGPAPGAQPGSVPQFGAPGQAGERTPSPRPGQTSGAPSLDDLRQRGRSGQPPQGLIPGRSDQDRAGRGAQPGALDRQPRQRLREQESRFRGQPGIGQPGIGQPGLGQSPTAQPPRATQPAGPRPGPLGPQPGPAPRIDRQPGRDVPGVAPQPGRSAPAARPQAPQQRPQPAARPQLPPQRPQPEARPQPAPQRPQPAAQPPRGPAPKATPAPRSGRSDNDEERRKGKGKGKD